jgi:hypothetical protein
MENVKIILDADVLIHFAKAEKLSLLPTILPRKNFPLSYDFSIFCNIFATLVIKPPCELG